MDTFSWRLCDFNTKISTDTISSKDVRTTKRKKCDSGSVGTSEVEVWGLASLRLMMI